MDLRQTGLGVVLFAVFLAFQMRFFEVLGPTAWVVGVIVFAGILWLIGKGAMPKRMPPDLAELWNFTTAFAIVSTLLIAYAGPLLGAVMPSGFGMTQLTPFVLGGWLIVFGAAMFVTGWSTKWGVTTAVGVIWVFSSIHLVVSGGPNSYLFFAVVVGLPFIIYGLLTKR